MWVCQNGLRLKVLGVGHGSLGICSSRDQDFWVCPCRAEL